MKNYIVINSNIYQHYKDEILPLNARLFTEPYFYNLASYQTPFDLKGLQNYLSYVDSIEIMGSSSFLDFTNLLLVLSYLKQNNYQKEIIVSYYFLGKNKLNDAMLSSIKLDINDLNDVDVILDCLKNKQKINNLNLKIPGFINYVNFINLLNDKDLFKMMLEDEYELIEDEETDLASYLESKYETMGLNKQFYEDYLKEIGE